MSKKLDNITDKWWKISINHGPGHMGNTTVYYYGTELMCDDRADGILCDNQHWEWPIPHVTEEKPSKEWFEKQIKGAHLKKAEADLDIKFYKKELETAK